MVELKGSLTGIGLPAIVQLIGELRHSGSLQLSKGAAHGVLDFDDGRLVGADFGGATGSTALAQLSLALADGEFTFVEGAPAHARTLDLASKDVQTYLRRVASGEDVAVSAEPTLLEPESPAPLGVCPLLGFADDRARHYSRPTALHRCFATGGPNLVSGQEQRELCLSGRYPTCPRYRNASPSADATIVSAIDHEVPAPRSVARPEALPPLPVQPEPILPLPTRPLPFPTPPIEAPVAPPRAVIGPPPGVAGPPSRVAAPPPAIAGPPSGVTNPPPPPPIAPPARTVPAGVAARMAAASTMHFADESANEDVPTWVGHDRTEPPQGSAEPSAPETGRRNRLRRALLLVGTGALAGLVILVGVVLVSMPTLNSGLPAQKPTVAGAQAFAPIATATRIPVDTARPATTSAPASATAPANVAGPANAAAPRPSAVTAPARPTVAPVGGALLDVRFAAGAGSGWLDNPPFAAWSDGAYRLQSHQATRFVAISAPVDQLLANVVVSGTFRKTGGPPGGGYGLVVRDQGPDPRDGINQTLNAYVFEAGDLGEFGIWRRDGDHWVDLVPWTRSTSVRPGGSPNDLSVRAIGDRLAFSINGTEVGSVQDDTLSAGAVGVFVGGDFNEVALDRFTVQLPG